MTHAEINQVIYSHRSHSSYVTEQNRLYKLVWTLLINGTDKKTGQVSLIDFSAPIPKEQDVIKEKLEGDFFF